ncbi:hypothetical protein ACFLSA_01085 [Bacteroidota bacterium]
MGFTFVSYGQEFVTELYGIKLGQFRDVPRNEFGKVIQSHKYEDGFEREVFIVEPDTSVHMIFEYAKYDLHTIWSIQLTGDKKRFDCGFKGLMLGMTKEEVISNIGQSINN